jgi:hypothetical protein
MLSRDKERAEINPHFAKCEECGVSFIYKVNPKG